MGVNKISDKKAGLFVRINSCCEGPLLQSLGLEKLKLMGILSHFEPIHMTLIIVKIASFFFQLWYFLKLGVETEYECYKD